MKVFIGPMNIASQPYYLARGLRKFGIDACSVAYGPGAFGYSADKAVDLPKFPIDRLGAFHKTLLEAVEEDFDIYHFFQRPFYLSIPSSGHDGFLGFEIPLLKARGKRIAYRFTGWELIDRDLELANNPYSAFRHGWDGHFNRHMKKEYLEFLRCYCDAFMVVDPMMHEHCPEADIVPRVLRVDDFEEVGIEKRDVPMVLHAPSNSTYKGSKFVLDALEQLKRDGVKFELKILNRCPFVEAVEWYKRADIIVDQLLIGWYGVLAMECMAMGKPVAVYMREDLANTPDEIPVHNINIDNIKERLKLLIEDYSLRESLASRGREYVTKTHDENVVIPKLIEVYEKMQNSSVANLNTNADLEFLHMQRVEYEKQALTIRKLKKQLENENPISRKWEQIFTYFKRMRKA